jgi:isoquinoline 1-oxidoreductase alpha subunit
MPLIDLQVNKVPYQVDVEPDMPLLWVLRDILGLTGTKYSCGKGLCGSCTVHLDGRPIRSCILPVSQAAGKSITTIEGLAEDGLHPLQEAWLAESVPQCGYCQPGQIMTTAALLAENPQPSDDEIDTAMSGNMCRCGTYQRIRRAIHRVVGKGGG